MVIKIAQMAKLPRSTLLRSVNFVTKSRNAPINTTLAKYENMASAIVAIGSKSLDIRATKI